MPKGYHHVTRDIRSQIYVLKATGTTLHQIAAIVGFHVSTISREIKRNTGGRGYRYKQADEKGWTNPDSEFFVEPLRNLKDFTKGPEELKMLLEYLLKGPD